MLRSKSRSVTSSLGMLGLVAMALVTCCERNYVTEEHQVMKDATSLMWFSEKRNETTMGSRGENSMWQQPTYEVTKLIDGMMLACDNMSSSTMVFADELRAYVAEA